MSVTHLNIHCKYLRACLVAPSWKVNGVYNASEDKLRKTSAGFFELQETHVSVSREPDFELNECECEGAGAELQQRPLCEVYRH